MTRYRITTLGGQYIRESMRSAETREGAIATLERVATYLGHEARIETWDDGRLVLVGDEGVDVASAMEVS